MSNLPAIIPPTQPAMPVLEQKELIRLARELASGIRPLPDILADFRISQPELDVLQGGNEFFKRTLDAFRLEWRSAENTPRRLQIEAAAALEDSLPYLNARMTRNDENLPAVVEAAKFFAKLAGVAEPDRQASAGERFTITIDLGDDKSIRLEKDVTPTTPPNPAEALPGHPEGVGDGSDVSTDNKERGGSIPLPPVPEGT